MPIEEVTAKHVAILGGGILGVSTAVHLLRAGASVTLLTETQLASEATGRSLSWLNSAGGRSRPYHELRMAGIDRYRTLFASDPTREWLQFGGGLRWAPAGHDAATLARHTYERSHAYDSQLCSRETIATVAQGVDSAAMPKEVIFNPGEGWVSLPDLVGFLMDEFDLRGGRLILNAGKGSVTIADGRTSGVTTTDGDFHAADVVLVACGAATPDIVAPLGVTIANASPVSMLVLTEPLAHGTKAVMNTPRAAVRPNPGNTLALDHSWYEASITEHKDGSFTVPKDVVRELACEAAKLLSGSPEVKPASWRIGRKPIPGDGEPVFGQLEKVPGCYVAFSHSEATLGLIAGELIADEIMTSTPHPMLETFRPERFS